MEATRTIQYGSVSLIRRFHFQVYIKYISVLEWCLHQTLVDRLVLGNRIAASVLTQNIPTHSAYSLPRLEH